MTWAKLDDAILDNPKIAAVGPIGFALHVAAITYCARNLTDGYVPFGAARTVLSTTWCEEDGRVQSLAAVSGMSGMDGPELIEKTIPRLVSVGLWEPAPGGYQMHDYLDYNPSKAKVLAEREKTRGRVSKHRRNAVTAPVTNGGVTGHPVPVPVKSPKGDSGVARVFERWREERNHPHAKLTDDRRRKVTARLGDGYTEDDLFDAILGVARDPWPERPLHDDLTVICRDGAHVERFLNYHRHGPPEVRSRIVENPVDASIRRIGMIEEGPSWPQPSRIT